MTELEYYEVVRFVTQCFRDNADKDYINARFCYFSKLDNQCLWSSQQAIEKYLKSILLYNGISTKNLNHNLVSSVNKIFSIKGIQFPFLTSNKFHEYIEYLDTFGNNRYHEFTSQLKHEIILNLDFIIWNTRKYCQRIREYKSGVNDIAKFPIDIEQKNNIELDFSKYPNRFKIDGGYLERIIQSKGNPLARKYLIYKNPYFGKHRKMKLNYQFHGSTFSTNLYSRPKLYNNLKNLVKFSKKTEDYFITLGEEKMQYRKLCGEEVSILGFGTMRFPILDKNQKMIDEEKAEEMLDYAIKNGVNYLDTAQPYHGGESENFVGRYLKKRNLRDKIFLATKLPAWLIKEEADFDKYFNEQLEKLQTDYFDFYLLHALNAKTWQNIKDLDVLKWCEKKKAEGKIKHIGFSFHDSYSVFKGIVDAYDKWEFCQIQYNYMDTNYQAGEKGFNYALKNGINVIVMEPLRGGQLSKEPPAEIKKLWQKFPVSRSYADGALQWLWNKKDVSILLSGMTTRQHVKENIESANKAKVGIFSKEELALFETIRTAYLKRSPFFCTTCKYCEPCPHGVSISTILGFYMMNVMYDDLKRAKSFYNFFLKEENRADKCIECGECESKCPQQIEIIKWLKEAHKVLKKDE